MRTRRASRLLTLGMLLLLATGCAAQRAYRRAETESRRENWDQAVLGYSKALALDPGNTRYGVALERAKLKASAQHFEKGKRYAASSQWDLAVAEFQQTVLLNPGNQHAANELEKAMSRIRQRESQPSEMERLKEKARKAALAPPKLSPMSNVAIQLKFLDQPLGKIFESLSKVSGLNFLYDDKVELTKTFTVDIGNVTLEKALDVLMLQSKNFYKVIDESTLLIAPDTRQKRQEYEDQVIRTFYLSNAETKQVVSLIRTLLNTRQVAENDQLNSVTIKDTPDKVAIAEKIIEANDKSKGEIVIDVELLEINRNVAQNLGIDLSSKNLSFSFRGGEAAGTTGRAVPLNNLRILRQEGNWLVGVIPSAILNFLKSDAESKTIAKPQLRVTEGEKAEILIGDRVPIPTTQFNSAIQNQPGGLLTTSFTYQNVGITVQLEPRVHHNKEVTLKVQVEVSAISGSVGASGGLEQPIIGTRQIQTVIRLRDGETNLLAGLIRKEERDTRSGVPGILDTPILGRIFGNTNRSKIETDIVLTLTPYIIRIPDITEQDLTTLWVGTEENVRLRGPVRGVLGVSPFAAPGEEETAETEAPPPEAPPPAPPAPAERPGREVGPAVAVPSPPAESAPEEGEPPLEEGEGVVPEGSPPPEAPPPSEPTGGQEAEPEPPRGPAIVRLIPSAPTYRVGDRVVVEVRIENGQNVGSAPFHLRYNRQVLEFVSPGIEGGFLNGDGSNTVFLANPAAGGGEIVVGLSRLGAAEGASGSGTLATFTFQAVNPGDTGFAFTGASVKDPQARNLPATFITAGVQVTP